MAGRAPLVTAGLEVRRDGPVGWLIFDRPDRANALDAAMLDGLEAAWRALEDDPEVRVIVNTGNGAAFQTGLDVAQLAREPEALREQSRRTRRAELRLTAWHNQVSKPVIAAVNGVCAGGGLHFVADADIVIASDRATFLDPHVSIGQVSAYEVIGLARKSPMEAVTRMALAGRHERMDATRARQLGILSEVVAPEALRARAQELGEAIARTRPRHPGRHQAGAVGRAGVAAARPHPTSNGGSPGGRLPAPDRRAARAGRLADQQPARPAQRHERGHARRVRRPPGWSSTPTPRCGSSSTPATAGRSRPASTCPRSRRTAWAWSATARAWRTGTSTSPPGTRGSDKPVITAVNGICAGGGFHWVADADIVICAADAQFFDPHTSIGQVVSVEAIGLMRKMPVEAVMRMALVGRYERMPAARAYELGMVSEVVDPPERLRERAQELAETIARNSPAAMAATKRALWGALEMGLTDACKAGRRRAGLAVGPPRPDRGPGRLRREAGAAVAGVSLVDLLPRGGDGLAVHAAGTDHSWSAVRDRSDDIACALADAGVGPGSVVGVLLPDGARPGGRPVRGLARRRRLRPAQPPPDRHGAGPGAGRRRPRGRRHHPG